jgi:ribosomal protein S18 acetylase RimI-like enzyme
MSGPQSVCGFSIPPVLMRCGFSLRAERPDDIPFLERLYISVRADEVAALDWPEEARRQFLSSQFQLQYRHYAEHYRGSEFLVLERDGVSVGRLYIYRGATDHRIVDISLLPEIRNAGVGRALLEAVLMEAAVAGKSVSIHVEKLNPALRLYRRLGFREIGESGPYWLMEWREGPVREGSAGA